jgi:hypothetical protein
MTPRRTLVWFLSLLCLLGLAAGALPLSPAAADGTLGDTPNPIGAPYGSTRAIDADNDATCADTQDRGDLLDFHAFSATGAQNGSRWFFAFVVDSDVALNSGNAIDQPNYFVILDDPSSAGANNNDNIPFWSNASPYSAGWTRNMRTPGTHFVACYANGADTLVCDLYDNHKQEVANVDAWTVTTMTLGGRRYVELALPDDADVPAYLRNNSAINTLVISTYNSNSHGNPIDAVGASVALNCHNNAKTGGDGRTFTAAEMIATAANCKAGGRPTDVGTNDRQCLSLPARTTTTVLNDITECTAANAGVIVNGTATNDRYTLLTEAGFAGPYQGGDTTQSDFQGESASYQRCWGSNQPTECDQSVRADLVNVYARGDAYFLYLVAAGELDSIASNDDDKANLFIALDLPDVNSGSAEAATVGAPNSAEFPNAPGGRSVNFHGWDVDRVVEIIWFGGISGSTDAAKLWRYTGGRAWASTDMTTVAGFDTATHTNASPPSNVTANLYYGRATDTFEVAIPWAALGYTAWTAGSGSNPPTCSVGLCRPALSGVIRAGAYTSYNDASYDVYDQAPGIGQGSNGLGSHERIGDEWEDTDDDRSGGEADRSPYSGETRNTYDVSSSDAAGLDVDTIESYFQLTLASKDRECIPNGNPLAVTLAAFEAEAQADRVLVSWETVSEIDNRGFNLYRGVSPDGWDRQLNALLIPSQAPGSPSGSAYTWEDQADLVPGTTYYYWLQDLDVTGATTLHGPVSVDFVTPTAVRLERVSATPAVAGSAALPWLLAVAGAGAGAVLALRRRPR